MNSTTKKLLWVSLFSAAIFSGCAFIDAHVDIAYLSETAMKSPLSTLKPMAVGLQVEDQRPAGERQWVGNIKNNFGMVTAWVRSNKDVMAVVQDAVKNELVNNGHKIVDVKESSPDVIVQIALKRYWSDSRMRFWDVEMIGTLDADTAILRGQNRTVLLSKPIHSAFHESRQMAHGGAHESVLNGALVEFVRSLARDPSILEALRATLQVKDNGETSSAP